MKAGGEICRTYEGRALMPNAWAVQLPPKGCSGGGYRGGGLVPTVERTSANQPSTGSADARSAAETAPCCTPEPLPTGS